MATDEFMAASSNTERLRSKSYRMAEFDRSKDAGGVLLVSPRMFMFGNAALMGFGA